MRSPRSIPILFALFVITTSSGCRLHLLPLFDGIKGSGKIVDETRQVPAFSALQVHNIVQATYEPADVASLSIRCDDNLLPFIDTRVEDGKLVIELKPNSSISPTNGIVATVKGPAVTRFEAAGASKIQATVQPTDRLFAAAQGASEVNLDGIAVRELHLEAEGASKLRATGQASQAQLTVAGASKIDAAELQATTATVEASGASHATVAADEVAGSASGASNVSLKRKPARNTIQTSGASSVKVQTQ